MTTPYTLPQLPYELDALEPWCSARTLEIHHDRHHRAYVEAANSAREELATVDPEDTRRCAQLRDDLTFQLSGHRLHSLFWENLRPDPVPQAGTLRRATEDSFGSVDRFEALFTKACAGVQGSGWGVLYLDPMDASLGIAAVRDHQLDAIPGATPLAVVDVWEHAYYLDHENRRPDWVEAAVAHLDWTVIAQRYDEAQAG